MNEVEARAALAAAIDAKTAAADELQEIDAALDRARRIRDETATLFNAGCTVRAKIDAYPAVAMRMGLAPDVLPPDLAGAKAELDGLEQKLAAMKQAVTGLEVQQKAAQADLHTKSTAFEHRIARVLGCKALDLTNKILEARRAMNDAEREFHSAFGLGGYNGPVEVGQPLAEAHLALQYAPGWTSDPSIGKRYAAWAKALGSNPAAQLESN